MNCGTIPGDIVLVPYEPGIITAGYHVLGLHHLRYLHNLKSSAIVFKQQYATVDRSLLADNWPYFFPSRGKDFKSALMLALLQPTAQALTI